MIILAYSWLWRVGNTSQGVPIYFIAKISFLAKVNFSGKKQNLCELLITRKENQRTLPFNVAIQDLATQKTVFSGSSSGNDLLL